MPHGRGWWYGGARFDNCGRVRGDRSCAWRTVSGPCDAGSQSSLAKFQHARRKVDTVDRRIQSAFFLGCGDSKDCYVASCRSLPLVSTLLVEVPYVITACDLHCYYDSEGKKHTCRKRVQAKDGTPGEVAKAKRRLLWWLYAGPSSSLLHLLNRLNALLGHDQHAPGPTCSEFPSL